MKYTNSLVWNKGIYAYTTHIIANMNNSYILIVIPNYVLSQMRTLVLGALQNGGYPKNGWVPLRENTIKLGDLGVPPC